MTTGAYIKNVDVDCAQCKSILHTLKEVKYHFRPDSPCFQRMKEDVKKGVYGDAMVRATGWHRRSKPEFRFV